MSTRAKAYATLAILLAVAVGGASTWAFITAEETAKEIPSVKTTGSPCRTALDKMLPEGVTVATAVNESLAHPDSALSKSLRPVIARVTEDQDCKDQSFLICTVIRGQGFCTQTILARRKGADAVERNNSSSGQSDPPSSGAPTPTPRPTPKPKPSPPVTPVVPPDSPGNSQICTPGVLPNLPAVCLN